jgi:hypothetical protein
MYVSEKNMHVGILEEHHGLCSGNLALSAWGKKEFVI